MNDNMLFRQAELDPGNVQEADLYLALGWGERERERAKYQSRFPVDVRAIRPVDASDKGASPKLLLRKLCGSGSCD